MMMLIDDEITTRTSRTWHHICLSVSRESRLDERCYGTLSSSPTYIHTDMNNWLLRMKFSRRRLSLSVASWVSQSFNHSLSWFLSQSVSLSVSQGVSSVLSYPICNNVFHFWRAITVQRETSSNISSRNRVYSTHGSQCRKIKKNHKILLYKDVSVEYLAIDNVGYSSRVSSSRASGSVVILLCSWFKCRSGQALRMKWRPGAWQRGLRTRYEVAVAHL